MLRTYRSILILWCNSASLLKFSYDLSHRCNGNPRSKRTQIKTFSMNSNVSLHHCAKSTLVFAFDVFLFLFYPPLMRDSYFSQLLRDTWQRGELKMQLDIQNKRNERDRRNRNGNGITTRSERSIKWRYYAWSRDNRSYFGCKRINRYKWNHRISFTIPFNLQINRCIKK